MKNSPPLMLRRWCMDSGGGDTAAGTARVAAKGTKLLAVQSLPAHIPTAPTVAREWTVKAMARLIDADIVLENIDEWLDTVGTALIGRGFHIMRNCKAA